MKKENVFKLLALTGYSSLLLVLVLNHEYWFDEAQAWNIARDNDIAGIFGMMKYEGHPPLWHLTLKLFTSLGCSWRALGLVSWGIMTVTAAVILFFLPIKPYLQAALLLSSGMLYTNSVVSRVYCLIYLLLAVIALIYPKRKKHPLLFGFAVAMLANTHICMCGLVGIIGIFMLTDFVKDFGSVSRKQNVFNALGLLIAGAGVVLLVVLLWGSLGANCFTAEKSFTPKGVLASLFMSFTYITESGIITNLPGVLGIFMSITAQFVLILAIIVLRRKRRTFTILLFFTAFYMVLIGVIWYSMPSRGALFIYALVMIWVMGIEEEPVPKSERGIKSESKLLNLIISLFKRTDADADKSLSLLFAVVMLISAPSGIKYAIEDICKEFDPSKAAAEFIRENISEDTLLISYNDDYVALMTYLPERKIYSLNYARFYSFCSHREAPAEADKEAFLKALEGYRNIWLISYTDTNDPTMIFSDKNHIYFYKVEMDVAIYEMPGLKFACTYLR